MSANFFTGCAEPVRTEDLHFLEREVGSPLPEAFKRHYTTWNGGVPGRDWFPPRGRWEPILVHKFLPLNTAGVPTPEPTIQSTHKFSTEHQLLPPGLLPFAIDPGGNFFCLDLANGAVSYQINDPWDANLSVQAHQEMAMRPLTSSFDEFVGALVTEEDAFGFY